MKKPKYKFAFSGRLVNDFSVIKVSFSKNEILLSGNMKKKYWRFLVILYSLCRKTQNNEHANHLDANELRAKDHRKTLIL